MEWNEADLRGFLLAITAQLTELEGDVRRGQSGTETVALDQQAIGRLSRQDALIHQAMSHAQQSRRSVEISRLNKALARIEAGEFGYCEDCGEPIARKRLELDLAATRCVDCAAA